jgi:spermidine synthase
MSKGDPFPIPGKLHPVLLALFFGSGCAALIYEIVWFQLLQLVIGSSAVSLGILLAVFMGGLCVGSLAFPRFASRGLNPLCVYALLELAIGLLGVGVLFLVPWTAQIYASHPGQGLPGFFCRGLVCGACLFPATVLMGATLPALARSVDTTPGGVSWLGLFYGANTVGAVMGCLLTGFYLLPFHDMHTAAYVAVALNGLIAVGALLLALVCQPPHGIGVLPSSRGDRLSRLSGSAAPQTELTSIRVAAVTTSEDTVSGLSAADAGAGLVYFTIAISGLCALGAEVVWTRLLSLMLGATVYTFSIILAVFLGGLGMGSGVAAFLVRSSARPRRALGICQLLLCAAMAWAAWLLAKSLPYWPINPSLSRSPGFLFQLDAVRCALALLPAACLWGASFPLALAAAARGCPDPAQLVGKVYAANTVGAVLGALGCSILLVAWLGTQHVQQLLMGLSALGGLLALWPDLAGFDQGRLPLTGQSKLRGLAAMLLALAAAALLAWTVPAVPWELVAHGRYLPSKTEVGQKLYMGEGMNASVAVTEIASGIRSFHVAGKLEASTDTWDMRMQGMLGHLPALLHPAPRSVLVVGCGAGVTAGTFVGYPSVKRIVICEIEPLIPRVVAQFFRPQNNAVLQDPRTEVIYDDARHYILTTHETFDIITSDPIHPWVKGAATLYTREYFELCKRHLNPGGLVTQ